jgi:hypothetical protein
MNIEKLLKESVYLAIPSASGDITRRPGTLEDATRIARAVVNSVPRSTTKNNIKVRRWCATEKGCGSDETR